MVRGKDKTVIAVPWLSTASASFLPEGRDEFSCSHNALNQETGLSITDAGQDSKRADSARETSGKGLERVQNKRPGNE